MEKKEMNNLQRYVEYVKPVVDAIEKHHNYYHTIQYFSVSAENIYAEGGYIDFHNKGDLTIDMGDLKGDIPMIFASTEEEGGGHLVIEIAPEQRELLSSEVETVGTVIGNSGGTKHLTKRFIYSWITGVSVKEILRAFVHLTSLKTQQMSTQP